MTISRQLIAFGMLFSLAAIIGCNGGDTSDVIQRVSRQNNSGTYVYFREAVLGEEREFKLGSLDQSGSKDVVAFVGQTPSAIGYSGMGYANDTVKMLSVSREAGEPAVAPTPENALDKSYPLARPLYLYTAGEPQGATKHFIDWCNSPEGQAIVTEIGYVSMGETEMPDTAPPPDGEVKVAGSDTLLELATKWAEVYSNKFRNVNVQVSGGGTGTGIKSLIDGTIQIATASRELKESELADVAANGNGDAKEFRVALDALAVYVHKDNPLSSISLKDLAEIYGDGGTITKWSQLGSASGSGN